MRERSELTLRKQRDFNRVYNRGKSKGSRYVVIIYKRNGLKFTRTAFIASKKVGNSVERNRSRRLMRESFRHIKERVAEGYDIIFVARAGIKECKEMEVRDCMHRLVSNCGLIRDLEQ